jgi:hypothetical protein
MKKPWHKANPALLAKIRADVEREYPDLRVFEADHMIYVEGAFSLICEGETVDRYEIKLRLPPDFPDSIPALQETAGRIPRKPCRHVNPNGDACPIVPEEWLLRPDHDSILSFLNGPVRNFFLGQSLVEQGEPWPFGERPHGFDGLFQAYGEMLGTTDRARIRSYLECLSKETIKGHWGCPCGSGKRLRNCHLNEVRALRERIPLKLAHQALARLTEQTNQNAAVPKHR